jgi:uncharacterized protein YqjF (DUF2071 family)
MRQAWRELTFLHWRYEPDEVQRLLPPSLRVDQHDGAAWVGLVPFLMDLRFVRPPLTMRFAETNVRTYVRDDHGRPGVWFFSLDAARLSAVVAARLAYRLPYFWSRMSVRCDARTRSYASRRRLGARRSTAVTIEIGEPYAPDALTDLDHFLTARWLLFSPRGRLGTTAQVWHQPWPLFRASLVDLDDELVTAVGLTPCADAPLLHFSPGVVADIGRPVVSRRRHGRGG